MPNTLEMPIELTDAELDAVSGGHGRGHGRGHHKGDKAVAVGGDGGDGGDGGIFKDKVIVVAPKNTGTISFGNGGAGGAGGDAVAIA